MIIGIIIGICIMSVFALLALCALDAGKDTLSMVLAGPAMWLWMTVAKAGYTIYKAVALYFFRRNYVQCRTILKGCPDDTYYIHKKVLPAFLFAEDVEVLDDKRHIAVVKDCTKAKTMPFKRYRVTPHGVGRNYSYTEEYLATFMDKETDFYKKMCHEN